MPRPTHFPFESGAHRHRVGTRTLDPSTWLESGPDAEQQMAEKRRLLAEHHDEVFAVWASADPAGVLAASEELLQEIASHLGVEPVRDGKSHPLDVAARLVPEDLCLHLPGSDGRLRLVAASVAFPSRWVLAEKIGQPVAEIHRPVPGYAAAIGVPVDRLLDKLPPGRGMWRLNGSVLDDAELFQPRATGRRDPVEVPGGIVLRVERQTLRRLPETGALVFTIRTFVHSLSTLADDPSAKLDLAGWLRGLTPELHAYKRLDAATRTRILDWLED